MATSKDTKAVVMPKDDADRLRRRVVLQMIPTWKSWTDVPAWLISTTIHVVVFVLLVALWQPSKRGTGGEADRPIGIALVHTSAAGDEYELQQADATASEAGGAAASASSAILAGEGPPVNMDSLLGELGGAGDTKGQSANEGTGTGLNNLGSGAKSGGAGQGLKTKTSVYGIEGEGSSFVYVFDRSDSMNGYGGGPLKSARRELMQSLESLKPVNQFQIVFYNETPTPYQSRKSGATAMLDATDIEKQFALRFVDNIGGYGGTEHLGALKVGIRYAPDVIFFLTDATEPSLNETQLKNIRDLCDRSGTTIHSIEFGVGPARGNGGWIEALATMTGGKYRYVDASQLKSKD